MAQPAPVNGQCRIIERFTPGDSDSIGNRYGEVGPRAGADYVRFLDYTTAELWLIADVPSRRQREIRGFIIYEHTDDWWVERRDFAVNP